MSLHETPMTHWYWQQVGGTLIEEFPAVRKSPTCSGRWIDGVIILNGERRIARAHEVDLRDQDIIVVQTKARRLGMYLMGQAFFSAELMKPFGPRSIHAVALCRRDDSALRPIFEAFPNMEVVVCPDLEDTPTSSPS